MLRRFAEAIVDSYESCRPAKMTFASSGLADTRVFEQTDSYDPSSGGGHTAGGGAFEQCLRRYFYEYYALKAYRRPLPGDVQEQLALLKKIQKPNTRRAGNIAHLVIAVLFAQGGRWATSGNPGA